jgi:hypothetical protein
MARVFPEAWREFAHFLPPQSAPTLLASYYRRLTHRGSRGSMRPPRRRGIATRARARRCCRSRTATAGTKATRARSRSRASRRTTSCTTRSSSPDGSSRTPRASRHPRLDRPGPLRHHLSAGRRRRAGARVAGSRIHRRAGCRHSVREPGTTRELVAAVQRMQQRLALTRCAFDERGSGAMTSENARWMARSRAAVWHPCTQMKQHETTPLVPIARGRGAWLYDFDGPPLSRRGELVVGQPVRARAPAHQRGDRRPARRAAARDARRLHASPGGRARRSGCPRWRRRPVARVLRIRRRVRHRDRAQDELPLLAQRGAGDKTQLRRLRGGYHGETLGALGVTDVALFRDAYGPLLRSQPVLLPPHARPTTRGRPPSGRRRTGGARGFPGGARRHDGGADRRAAGARRRRNGDVRRALPARRARAHAAPRRPPDRRRDHDRLRPHGNDVRVRAGGDHSPT